MRVYRSLDEAAAAQLHRPVVTLGMFDGVHIGHRSVIEHVVSVARERAGDPVVVTFGRHPRAIIEQSAPKLITSLPHKLRILEGLGVKFVVVLQFDEALRAMPAREFARKVFGEVLQAEVVLLGYNNRFGRGGEGDIGLLREVGVDAGFEARQLKAVRLGAGSLSSTSIREAILAGDLDRAARMLGRLVSVLGTVERGDGIGKQLGFPTANLDLHHEVRPPPGVYGCEAVVQGQRHFGLVNIGTRPTIHGGAPPEGWEARDRQETVEVHLLDFEGDLYGQDVEVVFLVRFRAERRFDGVDALVAQIKEDRAAFEAWLDGARGRDR